MKLSQLRESGEIVVAKVEAPINSRYCPPTGRPEPELQGFGADLNQGEKPSLGVLFLWIVVAIYLICMFWAAWQGPVR